MKSETQVRQQARKILSSGVRPLLRRAFGPQGLPFFEQYVNLYMFSEGFPVEGSQDLAGDYAQIVKRLVRSKSPQGQALSPVLVNNLIASIPAMRRWLNIGQQMPTNSLAWRMVNEILVPLMQEVAKDRGVYLQTINAEGANRRQMWQTFIKMNPKQERVERLKDEDPRSYEAVLNRRKTMRQIQEGIDAAVQKAGYTSETVAIYGRPVTVATDPNTGERFVYDSDGSVTPVEEYKAKREEDDQARLRLSAAGDRTIISPDALRALRKVPDALIQRLEGAPTQYVALTDDLVKKDNMTRVIPVKTYVQRLSTPEGEVISLENQVIVGGRYKGLYLSDVVNASGRLVEGTAYKYDEKSGRALPTKIDPASREPYVTVADVTLRQGNKALSQKKMCVKIGGGHEFKQLRDAMKAIAINAPPVKGSVSSVIWASQETLRGKIVELLVHLEADGDQRGIKVATQALSRIERDLEVTPDQKKELSRLFKKWSVKGNNDAIFYFDPKDFALVRERLSGLALSKAAQGELERYFNDLSIAENASAEKNLAAYTMDQVGGFQEDKKFNLTQRKALAWMEANGNRGVMGLETGMGKSLLSIGSIQKLIRDGFADSDATYTTPDNRTVKMNGRFLFVCPKDLKGNLKKEMFTFLKDPMITIERTDVLSYQEFSTYSRKKAVPPSLKKHKAWVAQSEWDVERYVAIIFDEAHVMADAKNTWSKAAQAVYHPRKILLTASPLQKSPMETYVLYAISNNKPLQGKTPEAAFNRREMSRFRDRFCEVLGGRIIGLKRDVDDPTLQQDLMTWVKRNVFYADKVNNPDVPLPPLNQHTVAVTMDRDVEMVYANTAKAFQKTMKALFDKFNLEGHMAGGKINPDAKDPEIEKVFTRAFAPLVRIFNGLSNYPGEMLSELAVMMNTGEYIDAKGVKKPMDPNLTKALAELKKVVSPEDLKAMGQRVSNPKLEQASSTVREKIRASEGTSRTLLFSDDPKLCRLTGVQMSKDTPGIHVVALDKSIHLFKNGKELTEWKVEVPSNLRASLPKGKSPSVTFPLPFTAKAYRLYPDLPASAENKAYAPGEWQTFVLNEIVKPNAYMRTATLLGKSYEVGQNLQTFDQVIHLDRDTWNSESMKQRTARAWRQGQKNTVEEITLDAVYNDLSVVDPTLDEINKVFQSMEGNLFDSIIKKAQETALGVEWEDMEHRQASFFHLDKQNMSLALSPYLQRSQPPQTG